MTMPSPARLNAAVAAAAIGLVLAAVGCFSDRAPTTAPPASGDCSIAIGGGIVGTTTAIVAIRDFSFQPAQVTVPVGTTVTWLNCEVAGTPSHTSTSDAGIWSSPPLDPGATFTQKFDQAGTFSFHCEPHPFMTGSVVVQ